MLPDPSTSSWGLICDPAPIIQCAPIIPWQLLPTQTLLLMMNPPHLSVLKLIEEMINLKLREPDVSQKWDIYNTSKQPPQKLGFFIIMLPV
jgi:hypothetical protein